MTTIRMTGLLLMALLWYGSRLQAVAEDPVQVIRIGVPAVGVGGRPVTGGSYLSSAHIKGLLEKEFAPDGIRIEWTFFKGAGPAVNEALANHQLDLTSLGDLPAIVGRAAGLRTRLILSTGTHGSLYLAVPAASPAHRLEDVIGKQLAVHVGTAAQLLMARVLAQRNLTERSFRFVNLDTVASVTALTTGEIDGVWGAYTLFEQEESGIARILFDSHADAVSGHHAEIAYAVTFLAAEEFAASHPDLVQRVVTVLVREAAYNSDEQHRDELFQLWEQSGVKASIFRRSYEGVPLALRQSPLLDPFFLASLAGGAKACTDLKYIRAPVDVPSWVDNRFLDHALATLGLVHRWPAYDATGAILEDAPVSLHPTGAPR
jgi:sulfonate transport system substrate-binding protein